MKKLNKKGFTLIELLAVIVIMGILMMVAIPAMQKYIDNSKKDTYANTAKAYVNAVKNAVSAGEMLKCGSNDSNNDGSSDGTYYIDASEAIKLLESGGKSSWNNGTISGYVTWTISGGKREYSVLFKDNSNHVIASSDKTAVSEDSIKRSNVTTDSTVTATIPSSGVKCTVVG